MKTIRKIGALLLMCIFTMGLVACSDKDDEGGKGGDKRLVGSWVIRTPESNMLQIITFMGNGIGSYDISKGIEEEIYDFTWSTSKKNGNNVITFSCDDEIVICEYEIDEDDNLVITYFDEDTNEEHTVTWRRG